MFFCRSSFIRDWYVTFSIVSIEVLCQVNMWYSRIMNKKHSKHRSLTTQVIDTVTNEKHHMLTRGLLAPVEVKQWCWMGRMRSFEIPKLDFPIQFEFLQPKNGFAKKEVEKHYRKINSIRKRKNMTVLWVDLLRFIHEFLDMKPKLFATKTNKTQTILFF